jgi:hypothetical protein
MLMEIQLYDDIFHHSLLEDGEYTSSMGKIPTKIRWVKNNPPHNVAVFTETHFDIAPSIDSKIKIAWLVESEGVHPWAIEKIIKAEDNFDYIFTHNEKLLERSSKYHKVLVGSSRVEKEDIDKEFNKDKLVSMIASYKTMTPGHIFRHEIIKQISGVDLWGSGYRNFNSKREPLSEYMYTISVMNAKYNHYFTEVLTDCFMYKAIPIFWGFPRVEEVFDLRGMYVFDTVDELKLILDKISLEDYNSKLEYVNNNYEIAKNNFMVTDDIVADKIKELGLDI